MSFLTKGRFRFGLSLAAGCAVPLAFPPFNWPWVYWLSWPVIVRLLDEAPRDGRLRYGALIGYGFGIGQFAVGLFWIGNAFQVNPEVFGWLEPIALALIALGLALFPALSGALAMAFWRPHPSRIAVLALTWTLGEWLRGHVLTGFPWNLAGLAFAASDQSLQIDALIGPYGLSLLAVVFGALPVLLFERPVPWRPLAGFAGLFAASFAYGAWRLAEPDPPQPGLRLRIVQPDMPEPKHLDGPYIREKFQRLLTLTKAPGEFDVALWPEAGVHAVLAAEPEALKTIAETIGPKRYVITGTFGIAPGKNTYFNAVDVVNGAGEIVATYDKSHLVPFGEYLPLRGLFDRLGLRALAETLPGGMAEGPGLETISVPGVPVFSPLVCYEILFSGQVVPSRPPRAQWIANVTNDVWFGQSIGPHQHFAQARLRAVEEGVPVARAANSGISAVIDAKGRVKAKLELGAKGYFDADLPGALAPPPASRGPVWLVLGLLAALWSLWARRSSA